MWGLVQSTFQEERRIKRTYREELHRHPTTEGPVVMLFVLEYAVTGG